LVVQGAEVCCAPRRQGSEGVSQRVTVLGELVDDATGRTIGDGAARDAGVLEMAQPFGEQARADAWESGQQIREASRRHREVADEEQRPALPDDVEGVCETAVLGVRPFAHVTPLWQSGF